MLRRFAGVLLVFSAAVTAVSQTPSLPLPSSAETRIAWDVVSIRQNHSPDHSGGMRILPDGFALRNMTIRSLFGNAFIMHSSQEMIGAPAWADSDRFDVQARMDPENAAAFHNLKGDQSRNQWQLLFRQILEDRFAMKYHLEKRELPVYELVVAKQGLKMKESAPEEKGESSAGPGRLTATKGRVTNLVYGLSGTVGRLIIDKTGLTAEYDIDLTWARDDDPDSGPSIFTALQEQLGLKLEPARAQVDVIVIDHFERPSEN